MKDNQAIIRVVQTGKSPTMRHLGRTHRISVAWLHEVVRDPQHQLMYEESGKLCADICTQGVPDRGKWQAACDLVNIADRARLRQLAKPDVGSPDLPSSLVGGFGGASAAVCASHRVFT